ncbi:MAG: hypothetical protein IJT02_03325 [Synergistaceae bacterium]|nr:hypothetical protein [Synergistaceae bacterium]
MTDKETLEMFLSCDMSTPEEVFTKFLTLPGARRCEHIDYTCGVYVPGTRSDRVLLVAHADTVFGLRGRHRMKFEDGKYSSLEPGEGIGADDRAGCAILWQLRDSGHSLLITNDEEIGSVGADTISVRKPNLYEELNNHSYILEFDRRHGRDYKVYDIPVTDEFKRFIEEGTGYEEADRRSSTDIRTLCGSICGANLSVGYYCEHTEAEFLILKEWQNTLDIARKLLEPPQKRFPLR